MHDGVAAEIPELDRTYGALRSPYKVDAWEVSRHPESRSVLNEALGTALAGYKNVSQNALFQHAARSMTYIWAMKDNGEISIAVEELAEMPDGTEVRGFPRRRNYPRHPAEEKKLGHPCLVSGGGARVAGELFLDDATGTLCWYVNVSSGRYCRFQPPTAEQVANVVVRFRALIEEEVQLDDITKE